MINKNLTRGVSAGALAALLSACGHLPIAEPAFDALAAKRAGIPTDWTVAPMTGDTAATINDYSAFNDAQLIALIQEALENNRTLRASMESLRQSELALQSTTGRLFPQITAGAGVNSSTPVDNFNLDNQTYSVRVTGTYDLDIMGDLNASIQSSAAGLRASQVTYDQARRQLAAQVARAYFAVIEQQLQLELDRKTLQRQRDTFRITQTRFDAGSIPRDELMNGESNLATAEDNLLAQEASLRQAVRAIEIAIGRFPTNKLAIAGTLPEPPVMPPLGLPELTVRSRPAVVAAELRMIQTFSDLRIAQMAPWPNIGLNMSLGDSNTTVNTTSGLFDLDNFAFSIGLSLAQTIFDGGITDARVKSAESRERQALETYGQTIIDAYGDIVNQIDQLNTLQSRSVVLKRASDTAQEVLRLGELRYNEGSQSLLDLFQVRSQAENAESNLISNRRQRLEQWILLHTALGGNPLKVTPINTKATVADQGSHDPK